MKWNHNICYHGIVLGAVPSPCRRALDVGCGRGELARKLAQRCDEVIAIDVDGECLAFAKSVPGTESNVTFAKSSVFEEIPYT